MNAPTRGDPGAALAAVVSALGQAPQPIAAFAALDRGLADTVGHRLFTILVVNLAAGENQRAYTSRPDAYPIGGSKKLVPGSEAMRIVVQQGRARITRNAAELIAAFPDHALIRSLGCESCINVPVRWNGATIGMLNLLHEAEYYSQADEPTLALFAAYAVAPLLEVIRHWSPAGAS